MVTVNSKNSKKNNVIDEVYIVSYFGGRIIKVFVLISRCFRRISEEVDKVVLFRYHNALFIAQLDARDPGGEVNQ